MIVLALGVLAIATMRREKFGNPDQLQALGTTLVVLGIVFGDDRFIGYSFIGGGVVLSILSVILRRRRSESGRPQQDR